MYIQDSVPKQRDTGWFGFELSESQVFRLHAISLMKQNYPAWRYVLFLGMN